MVSDARSRTKVYLDKYLNGSNLTKDDGSSASFVVMYANPDYPMVLEFKSPSNVDLIFAIGEPNSTPMIDSDKSPYGYEEHIPIRICCIDKTGITGTKLKWKAEAELRRVTEVYFLGSLRTMETSRPEDQRLGSTILYSRDFVLNYRRDTT
jgi:hypothetical protein